MAGAGICINSWVVADDLVGQQLGRNRIGILVQGRLWKRCGDGPL